MTKRDRIKGMLAAWNEQYDRKGDDFKFANGTTAGETRKRLEALNLSTCEVSAISTIVGNDGWTACNCDECGRDVDRVMIVGTDSTSVQLCKDCLVEAIQQLGRP